MCVMSKRYFSTFSKRIKMSSTIQVVLRFRPQNETEKEKPENCVSFVTSSEVAVADASSNTQNEKSFTFDRVLDPSSSQDDVFSVVGQPVVENVVKGYNGTVLAYGQTGSGKTHSMLGPDGGTTNVLSSGNAHYRHRGLIPRIIESLFNKLCSYPPAEVTWKVSVSIFELYRENIQDLLTEGPQQDYRIREDTITGRGIYVENLYAKQCLSASEVIEAVRVGASRRKVASTKSNETSSRSHSLTVLFVEVINHVQNESVTVSRLNLVDLAGSEKISKTQAGGDRLKEAQMINLSLTLLGNVIYKLTDGKSGYIPYRDSKLTRILQDSFGGNSVTTLLCHGTPALFNREETLSTLRFAARAKQIRNKPRVNRELSHKELQLLYAQALEKIRSLEERLSMNDNPRSPEKRSVPTLSGEGESPSSTIQDLLCEIEDMKKDLFEKEEDTINLQQQVVFYKQKAAEAERVSDEATSRLKREEQLLNQRLLDLQVDNDRMMKELGQPQVDTRLEGMSLGQRRLSAGHVGNMRKLGDRELSRGQLLGSGSTTAVTVGRVTGDDDVVVAPQAQFDDIVHPKNKIVDDDATQSRRHMLQNPEGHSQKNLDRNDQRRNEDNKAVKTVDVVGIAHFVPEPAFSHSKVDKGCQAHIGPSTAELMLKIADLDRVVAALKQDKAESTKIISEKDKLVSKLGQDLEDGNSRIDSLLHELDSIKKILETKEKENRIMKRILDELNINIEEQMALLGSEKERNEWLRAEAQKLRSEAQTLQATQDQQEYCDMASMELIVKTEDMDAVENELGYLSYSALTTRDHSSFAASRQSCLETLSQLTSFLSNLLSTLQGRTFNTSNLESQRLSIIADSLTLLDRVESSRSLLQDTTFVDVNGHRDQREPPAPMPGRRPQR